MANREALLVATVLTAAVTTGSIASASQNNTDLEGKDKDKTFCSPDSLNILTKQADQKCAQWSLSTAAPLVNTVPSTFNDLEAQAEHMRRIEVSGEANTQAEDTRFSRVERQNVIGNPNIAAIALDSFPLGDLTSPDNAQNISTATNPGIIPMDTFYSALEADLNAHFQGDELQNELSKFQEVKVKYDSERAFVAQWLGTDVENIDAELVILSSTYQGVADTGILLHPTIGQGVLDTGVPAYFLDADGIVGPDGQEIPRGSFLTTFNNHGIADVAVMRYDTSGSSSLNLITLEEPGGTTVIPARYNTDGQLVSILMKGQEQYDYAQEMAVHFGKINTTASYVNVRDDVTGQPLKTPNGAPFVFNDGFDVIVFDNSKGMIPNTNIEGERVLLPAGTTALVASSLIEDSQNIPLLGAGIPLTPVSPTIVDNQNQTQNQENAGVEVVVVPAFDPENSIFENASFSPQAELSSTTGNYTVAYSNGVMELAGKSSISSPANVMDQAYQTILNLALNLSGTPTPEDVEMRGVTNGAHDANPGHISGSLSGIEQYIVTTQEFISIKANFESQTEIEYVEIVPPQQYLVGAIIYRDAAGKYILINSETFSGLRRRFNAQEAIKNGPALAEFYFIDGMAAGKGTSPAINVTNMYEIFGWTEALGCQNCSLVLQ